MDNKKADENPHYLRHEMASWLTSQYMFRKIFASKIIAFMLVRGALASNYDGVLVQMAKLNDNPQWSVSW